MDGVFAEMQIQCKISYNFIIIKAYSDQFTISKDIDAESLITVEPRYKEVGYNKILL